MKVVSLAAFIVVASTSVVVAGAGIEAEPRDLRAFENRPIGIAGHVGLSAPIGWGGASLELAPTRFLVVSGGVGGNADGMQMMASLRGRVPTSRSTAVTLEAIGARGHRTWESSSDCDEFCSSRTTKTKEWDAAVLAGGAVGLEHDRRLRLRGDGQHQHVLR